MMSSKNRRDVENRLRDAVTSDKAHSEMTAISKFGMVEMTRERMRTAYFESINKKCEVCSGTGIVKTDEMVAITALREMHTRSADGGIKGMTCALPVESINYLINTKRDEIAAIEKEFKVAIRLNADAKLFPGQYTMTVEKLEEEKAAGEGKKAHKAGHPPEHKAVHQGEQKAELAEHAEHKEGHGAAHAPGHQPESEKRHRRSRGRRRGRRGAKAAHITGQGETATVQGEDAPKGEAAAGPETRHEETPKEHTLRQQGGEPETEKYDRHGAEHGGERGTTDGTGHMPPQQAPAEGEVGHGTGQEAQRPKRPRSRGRRRRKNPGKTAATDTAEAADSPAAEPAEEVEA
jgi:ribonuclease E